MASKRKLDDSNITGDKRESTHLRKIPRASPATIFVRDRPSWPAHDQCTLQKSEQIIKQLEQGDAEQNLMAMFARHVIQPGRHQRTGTHWVSRRSLRKLFPEHFDHGGFTTRSGWANKKAQDFGLPELLLRGTDDRTANLLPSENIDILFTDLGERPQVSALSPEECQALKDRYYDAEFEHDEESQQPEEPTKESEQLEKHDEALSQLEPHDFDKKDQSNGLKQEKQSSPRVVRLRSSKEIIMALSPKANKDTVPPDHRRSLDKTTTFSDVKCADQQNHTNHQTQQGKMPTAMGTNVIEPKTLTPPCENAFSPKSERPSMMNALSPKFDQADGSVPSKPAFVQSTTRQSSKPAIIESSSQDISMPNAASLQPTTSPASNPPTFHSASQDKPSPAVEAWIVPKLIQMLRNFRQAHELQDFKPLLRKIVRAVQARDEEAAQEAHINLLQHVVLHAPNARQGDALQVSDLLRPILYLLQGPLRNIPVVYNTALQKASAMCQAGEIHNLHAMHAKLLVWEAQLEDRGT